jgi:ubiquinone/menaquinone biosynthesis C-methylase UbiE
MEITELFKIGMDRSIPSLVDFKSGYGRKILNIGAGNKKIPGSIPLDYPCWNAEIDKIPFGDNSIDGIHCYHFLEHIQNVIFVLSEFQRILVSGGLVNIVVPYYKSQMMAHDLDHKHIFCEDTWKILFSNPYYDKNRIEWKFKIGCNVIIGIVERNLCLMTQLIKE